MEAGFERFQGSGRISGQPCLISLVFVNKMTGQSLFGPPVKSTHWSRDSLFLGLLILEVVVAKKEKPLYRLNDAMTDIGSGMGDQALGIFFGYQLALLTFCRLSGPGPMANGRSLDLGHLHGGGGLRLLLGTAVFATAWVGLGDARRAPPSEDYNLAVALRQPFFAKYFLGFFTCPYSSSVCRRWPSWALLRLTCSTNFGSPSSSGKWVYELVFNTPSHHRVHHGTNPQYIDKNYAGILIVWDRLFGTFAEEE